VSLRTLPKPIAIDLAVQTPGQSFVVRQQAQLTVELQLPSGPLRLRNVKWLVADKSMDEVLLGRPLLKELGLDAPSHLSANRQEYHDMDCVYVPSAVTGGKLSRLITRADMALTAPGFLHQRPHRARRSLPMQRTWRQKTPHSSSKMPSRQRYRAL
jgi:hypothetical protein